MDIMLIHNLVYNMKVTELFRRFSHRGDEFIKYVRVFSELRKIFRTVPHVIASELCKLVFSIQYHFRPLFSKFEFEFISSPWIIIHDIGQVNYYTITYWEP
jgi:hypothetical protein